MIITNTITISEIETLKTKTGVAVHENGTVTFSRIIDGKLRHYEVTDCTMRAATSISRMDDEVFKAVCASTEQQ